MRTFQEYLIDTYAIPFLEYVHSLDEQDQAELLSSLNQETLAILECVAEGEEFEAPNAAFDELRYDLNEEFQLDEGSSGIQRLKRKSGTRHPEEKVPPGGRSSTHLKMKRYYNSERIKSRGRKMSESSDLELDEGSGGQRRLNRKISGIFKKNRDDFNFGVRSQIATIGKRIASRNQEKPLSGKYISTRQRNTIHRNKQKAASALRKAGGEAQVKDPLRATKVRKDRIRSRLSKANLKRSIGIGEDTQNYG